MKRIRWQTTVYFIFAAELIFGLIACVGGGVGVGSDPGNDTQVQISKYTTAKAKISEELVPFNMENRAELHKSMDSLPRIVWGKVKRDLINKKNHTLNNNSYMMAFYDLDNDSLMDQFVLQTIEGKEMQQEFGFPYDLNKDGKIDYIIYNGGTAISNTNEIYYYFYHWIDTDYDGKIDAVANNIIVQQDSPQPDPRIILWIMDRNADGKPDYIDFIDAQNGKITPLIPTNGIWNYKTLFGPKQVDSNDGNYFNGFTEFLKALNE